MKDTGEQTIQIPLDEFGPKRFFEWLGGQKQFAIEHIVKAYKLPFVQVMQQSEYQYRDYLSSVVRDKIVAEDFDVRHISVGNRRIEFADEWIGALHNKLVYIFESEFGINGMTPRKFVSAIIKHSEMSIKYLNGFLNDIQKNLIDDRNVPEKVIRFSCLLCREWENLTNLLYEMALYISKSDTPENKFESWSQKLNSLDGFSESDNSGYLKELLTGEGSIQNRTDNEILTIDHKITVILNAIRAIRNKVAHPSSLTAEDIGWLVEYSGFVLRKLKNACPLLARVVSVTEDANGLKEVGIYTEVDQQRKQPRSLLYRDVFGTGDEPDSAWIGKEVILFPTVIEGGRYMIKVEAPAILLRKQEFVEKVHSVTDTPVTISITYTSREPAPEAYIPAQEIAVDE
ncbi:MAG: hypothetical protein KatS3mg019_1342 [Fimbriimonadales bacterium]|nr:MAG: hypothetical protein KatS3mg019_1342 [Fimbriimonadales bacterium]